MTQYFPETVNCRFILLFVHMDCSHENHHLFLLNRLDHILITIKTVVQDVKTFLIPLDLIVTIRKSYVGLYVFFIVTDAIFQ